MIRTTSAAPLLFVADANGSYRPATSQHVLASARNLIATTVHKGTILSDPRVASDFLSLKLAGLEHEVFAALLLTNRHRLIEYTELFRGTIDGCAVHPREVVKAALAANAAAVILAHNHPSGYAEPSESDRLLTDRLRDALALVEIRVLDHIIIAGPATVSMAARGLL